MWRRKDRDAEPRCIRQGRGRCRRLGVEGGVALCDSGSAGGDHLQAGDPGGRFGGVVFKGWGELAFDLDRVRTDARGQTGFCAQAGCVYRAGLAHQSGAERLAGGEGPGVADGALLFLLHQGGDVGRLQDRRRWGWTRFGSTRTSSAPHDPCLRCFAGRIRLPTGTTAGEGGRCG